MLISVKQKTCIISAKDHITMTSVPIHLILLLLKWHAGSWNTTVVHSHHCHIAKLLCTDSTYCLQTRKQSSHVLISHIILFFVHRIFGLTASCLEFYCFLWALTLPANRNFRNIPHVSYQQDKKQIKQRKPLHKTLNCGWGEICCATFCAKTSYIQRRNASSDPTDHRGQFRHLTRVLRHFILLGDPPLKNDERKRNVYLDILT